VCESRWDLKECTNIYDKIKKTNIIKPVLVSHIQPLNLLYSLRHVQFDKHTFCTLTKKRWGWRNEIVIVCFYIWLLVKCLLGDKIYAYLIWIIHDFIPFNSLKRLCFLLNVHIVPYCCWNNIGWLILYIDAYMFTVYLIN